MFQIFKWMTVIFILFMGLMIVGLPIFNWVSPWPEAEKKLDDLRPGNLMICVGRSGEKKTENRIITHDSSMRTFILIPDVFREPSVYAYHKVKGEEDRLEIRPYNAIFIAFVDIVILGLSYLVIKKMILPLLTSSKAEQVGELNSERLRPPS